MIGFSTVLGVGLFLSGGKAIYMAGPGGAVLAYLLAGTIMWYGIVRPLLKSKPVSNDQQVGHGMYWGDDCTLPSQRSSL